MRSLTIAIPLQILFTILLLLSVQTSTSAFTLPFPSLSSWSPPSNSFAISPRGRDGSSTNPQGYISSSKRLAAPKRFGYFSFSRHPNSLPDWIPLQGVEGVLVHRGIASSSEDRGLPPESSSHKSSLRYNADSEEMLDHEEELVERDEVNANNDNNADEDETIYDYEECDKREAYDDPTPIAQLGSIPEQQIQQARLSTMNDTSSYISAPSSNLSSTTIGDRTHSDKILWSGIESLQPLENGLFMKRHHDKSGNSGSDGYNDNEDDHPSRGGSGYGKYSKGGHLGYGNQDEGTVSHGNGNGNGNGNGWIENHLSHSSGGGYTNGKGRPNKHGKGHENGSAGGNDRGLNGYDQDWKSPTNDHGNHGYGTSSDSADDDQYHDGGQWRHHPPSDGLRGSGSDENDGNGKYDDNDDDSYTSRGKGGAKWGQHRPSSDNDGYASSYSSSTNNDKNKYDEDEDKDENDSSGYTTQSLSSSSNGENGENGRGSYGGGGAHRLAQTAYGRPSKSDCARLMQFYRGTSQSSSSTTTNSGWINSNGWDDDEDHDCCNWFGVTCDQSSRRVTSINLRNNGLTGGFSNYIFALDALLKLDLSQNSLMNLPDRFGSLPHLTHLNVSSSSISNHIPSSILFSSSLINLDISHNNLTGYPSFSSSTMRSVQLSNNRLDGFSIDSENMSELSKIDISNNGLKGDIPDLSKIAGLNVFDASNNNTGPLFDLTSLTNLTRLDVRFNQLTGSFPTLPSSLQSLYLSSNLFDGPIPSLPAPDTLTSCYILPNSFSPCPTPQDLSDPGSIASKCHLSSCSKGNNVLPQQTTPNPMVNSTTTNSQVGTKGIPVHPLPGETLDNPSSQSQLSPINSPDSTNPNGVSQSGKQIVSGDEWPGVKSQPSSTINPQSQRLGSTRFSNSALDTISSPSPLFTCFIIFLITSCFLFGFP
ncbi:uncharacterized protein IL334_004761 [Kwoniella shivajii]|uniref:Leucine-rich repeat-containing N-terminal plant-type domain-containing protein n=1 Tax=Kwoniella shivajii TaxID=564305 RepID=A0ABZ1D2G2_9TREE|nr:hypothetical protein IL334_004761 [Kwoniella shivajii]